MAYGSRNYAGRSYADGAGLTLAGTPNLTKQTAQWQSDVNVGILLGGTTAALWQADLHSLLINSRAAYLQVDENFGFVLTNSRNGYLQVDENFGLPTSPGSQIGYWQVDEFFVASGAGGAGTYGGFKYGALQYAQFLVRLVTETLDAAADAASRSIDATRSADDEAPADDEVESFVLMFRTAEDAATAFDTVVRAILLFRSGSDTAPADDEVERVAALFRRNADDNATASDDAATRMVVFIRLADDAPITGDMATRQVNYFRGLADSAFANEVITHQTTQFRVGSAVINPPTDEATAFVTFGAPDPTIAFLSGDKVGWAIGADRVTMAFTFDKQVFAWEVRANSTGPHDGNRIASWASEPGLETVDHGEVEILAADLLQGDNQIVVYGFTHSGGWTPHPLP